MLNALDGLTKGWATHPAALMWRGYETALAEYGVVVCTEWKRRGYKDTMLERLSDLYHSHRITSEHGYTVDPPWLGNADFHIAHQSNLLRKFPEFYRPLFPNVPDDLPYIWPTNDERTNHVDHDDRRILLSSSAP